MIFGLIVGGLIGLLIGGGRGLLIGGLIGYFAARPLLRWLIRTRFGKLQERFLESVFAVMGAVCKADGQVTEDEIQVAEALFTRFRLDENARNQARAAFNRGKAADFDLDAEVAAFASTAQRQRPLLAMFLQIQISAVGADGRIHPAEHEMLVRIARGLGFSEAEVARMEAMLRGGGAGAGGQAGGGRSQVDLDWAYEVLGVSPEASDDEVKRAYRKLVNENHPDRLAAKGLPESMRPMAEEKTRDLTTAYDRIKSARASTG
ncbi:co-chaperone DjlA [Algiphilus sp.]|uniref:co-chaperone DjlA n=1 Tax=Algiphilus sp. TaxID=1872431 RepID=UPI0025BB93FB|nr:co-chaperone DjlA [Algiphilus sp.]MCK5769860.1 co-chaperone DjlA [Algiphilus sp.]